jgi:hypothetical protein
MQKTQNLKNAILANNMTISKITFIALMVRVILIRAANTLLVWIVMQKTQNLKNAILANNMTISKITFIALVVRVILIRAAPSIFGTSQAGMISSA